MTSTTMRRIDHLIGGDFSTSPTLRDVLDPGRLDDVVVRVAVGTAGSAEELAPLLVREHGGVLWEAQTDFALGTGVLQHTAGLVEEFSQALAKGIELCRELGNRRLCVPSRPVR